MNPDRVNKIITLGPATRSLGLHWMMAKGVDFVRNNMSHSTLDDLQLFMESAREAGIPFILDTEGSQIRTGELADRGVHYDEGQTVRLHRDRVVGNAECLCLTPGIVIDQIQTGDVVYIDFDALILLVTDTSEAPRGHVTATAINHGFVGSRKAVYIDRISSRHIVIPTLSDKDYKAIAIALGGGVDYIAASFIRSGNAVDEVRSATQGRMQIISKIECLEALENLDSIIDQTDYLLLDRGDMSKEIPIEKIPYSQKIIIGRARRRGKRVIVATNLLETMIEKRRPTRAEVNDVVNTIQDGAIGLTLAAETAIGKHPIECVNVLNKLITQADRVRPAAAGPAVDTGLLAELETANYLLDIERFSTLAPPHGGVLVDRVLRTPPPEHVLRDAPRVIVDDCQRMDLRQIATGAYSPLTGFMGRDDLQSVLADMRLKNGVVWPIPIVLDVPARVADQCVTGQTIALVDESDQVVATMVVDQIFEWDREVFTGQFFGTTDPHHPGVQKAASMQPVLLGGPIEWIPHAGSEPSTAYHLTPRQVRRLFEERAWSSVVAFHTRNIPHRAHEYIQRAALEQSHCDGLFVHPVVGKKKQGDFEARYIIACHERLIRDYFPENKVVFASFPTYSRYAGPRESLFTGLCRKNFGCSHFIVGRDHTGVADFYEPTAAQEIFARFGDLGIEAIRFGNVLYAEDRGAFFQDQTAGPGGCGPGGVPISGSSVRELLAGGEQPPDWMVRPEISRIIVDAVRRGDKVFVDG